MGKVVRRRVKHPYSQVMPLTTLDERGVALSGLEVGDLSSRLAHSDVDRFLTYDLERDGARPLCLYLDGRDGGFRVEFGPDAVRVRAKGVCVAVAAEGPGGAAPGGAVEVSTHGQLLDLLYEIAYVLAGATRVSRAGGPAGGSPRDVYVENAHSRPCVKRIGGIAFHVNRAGGPGAAPAGGAARAGGFGGPPPAPPPGATSSPGTAAPSSPRRRSTGSWTASGSATPAASSPTSWNGGATTRSACT